MQKENIQIITLSVSKKFLEPNTIPAKNLQDTANKVKKFILIDFCKTKFRIYKEENIYFISVHRLGSVFYLFRIWKEIKKILDKNIKTIITAGNPFDLGILGIFLKILLKIPLNIQIHTDIYSKYFLKNKKRHYLYYLISEITLIFANSIRTVSKNVEDKLKDKFPNKLIKNIPEISELKRTEIVANRSKDELMFLCPARYVYGKNIDRLILAFIKFHKKYLNTKLRIVGDGELKEYLLSLIKEKSSEDFISLNSWSENMSEEYINTDYTILTSEFEGFGMILVESMKFGKPFLATPFGGATYLINDGINGFIAKDFSVEAIYELLEKSYLYKESFFSEKIKESVKNLTKQNMDEELIRLWKETI